MQGDLRGSAQTADHHLCDAEAETQLLVLGRSFVQLQTACAQ